MEVMMLRANVIEDREATMSRFLGGLNREIQDIVEMQNCVGLESMLHKAVLAETQLKRRAPTRMELISAGLSMPETPNRLSHQSQSQEESLQPRQGQEQVQYNLCPRARELKCFRCQGFGHYANECRNKKIMFIRDNGEVESEEEV
ncbi:unnamed protein product [Microthlaspi erraticum]|uniref:CCHC-type domain-containing protein n=1 Tax=Microthlaspi erraticum TaxID=1685480 RepID=A0A6D2JZY1_9BRAS|nr:unnamed protein product [Microthlaspi erraticum]